MQRQQATAATLLLLLFLAAAAPPPPPPAAAAAAAATAESEASLLSADSIAFRQQLQQQRQRLLTSRRVQGSGQFFTLRPQCNWEEGACAPMLSNWNMYRGVPNSPYRRAQLLSTSRMSNCNKTHNTAAACYKDQANRCYWVRTRDGVQQCQSADYFELLLWIQNNFTADIFSLPTAMTCPGSQAAEFFACFSRPDIREGCQQLPGCYKADLDGGTVCLPKWIQKATTPQFESFYDSLVKLDSKLYGSCAAACWLRQAEACLKRTPSGEEGCQKAPYCFWNPANKICLRNTLEFEGFFDKQVQRLYMMCYETETQQECIAHVIPTKHAEAVAAWTKLAQAAAPVQCQL